MHRFIKFLLIGIIINLGPFTSYADALNSNSELIQDRLNALSTVLKTRLLVKKQLDKNELPVPFDYLLIQPLLTVGIESYYKRTPIIRVLYTARNLNDNSYTRVITMLLDSDSNRDNPTLAQQLNKEIIVELALISINFKELPLNLVSDILTSKVPFGALLKRNQIATHSINQYYFSTVCNAALVSLLKCRLKTPIYGRTNTIVRADNNRSIAQVIELLPVLNIINN